MLAEIFLLGGEYTGHGDLDLGNVCLDLRQPIVIRPSPQAARDDSAVGNTVDLEGRSTARKVRYAQALGL